jgi:hypothetical protein
MRWRPAAAPARCAAAGRARSSGRARGPPPRPPGRRLAAATPARRGCRPRRCGRCPRAAGAGWHNPGWPSSGPGSCSRCASRRCRARTPPAAPVHRRAPHRAGTGAPVRAVHAPRPAIRDRACCSPRRPRPAARRQPRAAAPAPGPLAAPRSSHRATRCCAGRQRRGPWRVWCSHRALLQCMSAGPGAAPAAVGWGGRLRCSQPLIFSTASST